MKSNHVYIFGVLLISFFLMIVSISSCKPKLKDRESIRATQDFSFKAMYSEAYFMELQDSLDLDPIILKSLKVNNKRYKHTIRSLQTNKSLSNIKKKELRYLRKQQEKEILGMKQFRQKVQFDKIWLSKSNYKSEK